jgi:hypothetical protein
MSAMKVIISIETLKALFEYATKNEQFPIDEPFNSYLRECMAALDPPCVFGWSKCTSRIGKECCQANVSSPSPT